VRGIDVMGFGRGGLQGAVRPVSPGIDVVVLDLWFLDPPRWAILGLRFPFAPVTSACDLASTGLRASRLSGWIRFTQRLQHFSRFQQGCTGKLAL